MSSTKSISFVGSRRDFLRNAAMAAGAALAVPYIIPGSALGTEGKPAASNRITMGFIGTGNQGTNDLRGFLQDDRVQIVAVCDVNRESPGYWSGGVKLIVSNRFRSGVTFEGTEGRAWADRGSHDANPRSILQSKIGPNEIHLYESPDHYRNFIDCVISRKEPVVPVETAHRNITICHLGNIAMRLGRKSLKWDPDKEQIVGDPEAAKMLSRPYRAPSRLHA